MNNAEIIGKKVVAVNEYWGTYLCEVVEICKSYTEPMARVRILKTIKQPRQDAILFPENSYPREEFKVGEFRRFQLRNIICITWI